MSQSKASRERQKKNRFKNHRQTSRAQLLPKKVAREEMKFDYQYALMKQQIEKAFPDPTKRLEYINSLLRALDEASREIQPYKVVETGRTPSGRPESEPELQQVPATSGYAITEQTVSFDDEPVHGGECGCGCHEEHDQ